MTGNINMGTHSVFNLKQPEKPKIELPSETDKPKDPREEDGFAEKTAEEQEQEIKEYNTKLAEYQKKSMITMQHGKLFTQKQLL